MRLSRPRSEGVTFEIDRRFSILQRPGSRLYVTEQPASQEQGILQRCLHRQTINIQYSSEGNKMDLSYPTKCLSVLSGNEQHYAISSSLT
jgi:hypothetical protein